jgi:hypothetical protein
VTHTRISTGSSRSATCQIEIAGGASSVLPSLAFGGRTVNELLERRPQRHRFVEKLDADPISSRFADGVEVPIRLTEDEDAA